MQDSEIMQYVDHTLLKAVSSWAEIEALCREGIQYKTASVCVPPSYVGRIKSTFGDDINICTVIGFPLGYSTTETKAFEAGQAIAAGASEIDMVINLGDVKNGNFDKITAEIREIKQVVGQRILKVIIETCYLTEEEKIKLCHCVTSAAADYIKTSTGFGTGGATLDDVFLFKQHIGPDVKIKAAGGIKSRDDLVAFIQAGVSRIGTSSAIKLLSGHQAKGY